MISNVLIAGQWLFLSGLALHVTCCSIDPPYKRYLMQRLCSSNSSESKFRSICMYTETLHMLDAVRTPLALENVSSTSIPLSTIYFLYHILVIFVCRIFFCNWKIPRRFD